MNRLVSWFWSLSKTGKAGVLLVYFLVLGASVSAAVYPGNTKPHAQASSDHTSHAPSETLAAVIEKQIEMKFDEDVPFKKTTVEDPTLPKGESYIRTTGVNGKRNVTYEVTYTDGVETDRKVLTEEILQKPADEVKVVGTKTTPEPEPQVQGTQTQSEKPAATSPPTENPEPEPSPLIKKVKVWRKGWKYYCVGPDSVYYERNAIQTYTSIDACVTDGGIEPS